MEVLEQDDESKKTVKPKQTLQQQLNIDGSK